MYYFKAAHAISLDKLIGLCTKIFCSPALKSAVCTLQPLYEMQSVRASYTHKPGPGFKQGSNSIFVPPSAAYTSSVSRQNIGGDITRLDTARSTATLSSNLSELDSLLQELSSAQFAVEVDRRTAG
jgi:hypothetical protein